MTTTAMTTTAMMTTMATAAMMTAMTTTTGDQPWRRRLPVERIRIVAWFVVLLVAAAAATALVVREILLNRLDRRIEAALVQEVDEVRRLVGGNDPLTGDPFGDDVEAIFETFLARNVPPEHEALFTLVDGTPFLVSFDAPWRLDGDDELVARWASLSRPARGETETPVGPARWLAMPLQTGDETRGVFVVANFVNPERSEVDDVVRTVLVVSALVVGVGSILAWGAAGRLLAPVRQLTATAASISAARQLDRRIEVRRSGELARLATSFNEMIDRLQHAFEGQRAFLNDASHELRTPLTIVRGHLQLLDEDPIEREATLQLVIGELDRMNRIVDDLLLLARAEQPGFLRHEPVDVDVLVDDVVANAATLGPRQWVIDARAEVNVHGDPDRLKQAMLNLVANAAAHTDDGAEIGVGASRDDSEVSLWVRDTGHGVPPGDESRIFGRFARGENSGGQRGSGLGLAITRAIADAHGGRIVLANRPGEGATFTLILPVLEPSGGRR